MIKLPCNIGDKIFVVEDYNEFYDKCHYYETKYGNKIVLKEYMVDVFIVDENGVHIGEYTHDGAVRFDQNHDLTLNVKWGDCKIFFNELEAKEFIKGVRR